MPLYSKIVYISNEKKRFLLEQKVMALYSNYGHPYPIFIYKGMPLYSGWYCKSITARTKRATGVRKTFWQFNELRMSHLGMSSLPILSEEFISKKHIIVGGSGPISY